MPDKTVVIFLVIANQKFCTSISNYKTQRATFFSNHSWRKLGLRAAKVATKIAMTKPPAASVRCTPKR
jgi:hypothetical protein